MATAKMTLIGMYNVDDTLFNSAVFPDGIDPDLFRDTLLLKGGEFEVLYPDLDFMKFSIGVVARKWSRTFAQWVKGAEADWNPIYNYDRFEESKDTDKKDYSEKTTANYSSTREPDLNEKTTYNDTETTEFNNTDTTTQTVDGTTQHDVSAFDQSGYTPSSKDTINNGATENAHDGTIDNKHTGTVDVDTTGSDKTTTSGTISDRDGDEDRTMEHDAHIYGNIGVVTSSKMLGEWYEISSWSLYDHIADVFIQELLIPVYS